MTCGLRTCLAPQRLLELTARCAEKEISPELVREAKRLRPAVMKGHQRSLRDVSAELAKLGFVNQRGVFCIVGARPI